MQAVVGCEDERDGGDGLSQALVVGKHPTAGLGAVLTRRHPCKPHLLVTQDGHQQAFLWGGQRFVDKGVKEGWFTMI